MKRPEKSAAVIAFIVLVRVLLEPVRSAEPPIISGTAGMRLSSANSRRRARGDVLRRGGERLFHRAHRVVERLRQVAAHAALELGALAGIERGQPLAPVGMRLLRALAGGAPGGEHIVRHVERLVLPAERRARALDLVGAERRAVRGGLAGLGRRAVADLRLAGDQHRACRSSAPSRALRQSLADRGRRRARRSSRPPRSASPGRRCRTATARRRSKCRCRRTARSAC